MTMALRGLVPRLAVELWSMLQWWSSMPPAGAGAFSPLGGFSSTLFSSRCGADAASLAKRELRRTQNGQFLAAEQLRKDQVALVLIVCLLLARAELTGCSAGCLYYMRRHCAQVYALIVPAQKAPGRRNPQAVIQVRRRAEGLEQP